MTPKPLRILFDARMASWGGIGSYSLGLLGGLAATAESLDLSIAGLRVPEDGHLEELPVFKGVRWHVVGGSVWLPAPAIRAGYLASTSADVYHRPHVVPVYGFRGAMVTTIHDVIPLLTERCAPEGNLLRACAKRRAFTYFAKDALLRSDIVVFDSRDAAEQAADHIGVPRNMDIVPPAPHSRFTSSQNNTADVVNRILGTSEYIGRYILWVGGFRPHKNLESLIRAFAQLDAQSTGQPLLVLAGEGKGEYAEYIRGFIHECGVASRVLFTGHVLDDDLPALYKGASVFAFPSLAEGFGLPPLEAACSGVPVVCSRAVPSLAGLGDAVLAFDPNDTVALHDALRTLLHNPELRIRLAKKARARATQVHWNEHGRRMAVLYRRALKVRAVRRYS